MKKICCSLLAISLFSTALPISSYAATISKYEVKVFVKSDAVINNDHHIKNSILSVLGSEDKDEDFNVQFIDDLNEHLYSQNYSFRVRKSEDKSKTELQYKKRYSISNEDIQSAMKTAESEGFKDAVFEVEFGTQKHTLSVTKEVEIDTNLSGNLDLPSKTDSLKYFKNYAPVSYIKALNTIISPKKIGPVHFERHIGNIKNVPVKIENWDINNKNIVEISTKVNSIDEAKKTQAILINELKSLNIYEPQDQLKTELIFNAF